jgi:NADPH:quinone reductase-like Zn-dependent oxidoreductase
MKAAAFQACGGPDQVRLTEVASPKAGPGKVLLEVRACGLNHFDLLVLKGPDAPASGLPFWGGGDVAGVVVEVGPGVSGLQAGARVLVNPALWCGACEHCLSGEESLCLQFGILGDDRPGGLAEFVAVPASNVMPIPEEVTFEAAAAVPLVFQTAWRALVTQGRIRPGDDVLIIGAGGGVATAAIQIARLAGARVIGITSTSEKVEKALRLGADLCINRRDSDPWRAVREITNGRGVDLVLDSIGQVTWGHALSSLVKGGRLVTVGRTSGRFADTDVRLVFWNQLRIVGSTMANRREFAEVMRLVFSGRLQPVIDSVLPLAGAAEGYRRLESAAQFGKIVIRPEA